jgi:Glycosyl hydrolase family 99
MPSITRRRFLERAAALPAALPLGFSRGAGSKWKPDLVRLSSVGAALEAGEALPAGIPGDPLKSVSTRSLGERFADLPRHFIFEYYPWYARDPWRHWNEAGRRPPDDLATEYFPLLGAYDSRSRAVLEQHARWIASSGAGAISLSWWGSGNFEDRAVHDVMDVMKDHGIAVTFGLEPYAVDRGHRFASDVLYLLTEYGERRGWDSFLILRNEDGSESPVLKGFRCILPESIVDCHGITRAVSDYTPDDLWTRQIEIVRREMRWDFDRIVLLADSLDFGRTPASGFDGIGIYDNFITPEQYHPLARAASQRDLLFSFNVNPGYDEILQEFVPPESCYQPRPFSPPSDPPLDFERFDHRERAAELSAGRIRDSLAATIAAQSDETLSNHRRGFFLAFINSFNEWHEGHAFEPMKDEAELTDPERLHGYHNPRYGDYRMTALSDALRLGKSDELKDYGNYERSRDRARREGEVLPARAFPWT